MNTVQPTTRVRRHRWGFQRWDDNGRRARVIVMFLAFTMVVRTIGIIAFSDGRQPTTVFERITSLGAYAWLGALPATIVGVVCWLLPRPESRRRGSLVIGDQLSFRIVSRGRNIDAVTETVLACRAAMQARPLFPYRIEVVTDEPVTLPAGDDVVSIVVPASFRTDAGALYKARALEFANEVSTLPDDGWILHLDEESHPTQGLIGGLRDFILDCAEDGHARIGQGCILYHRQLRQNPLLTMADSLRTGDDVSRFYIQYRAGVAVFGMHGSFILVRNDVSKAIGFDFGAEGSITEDAWWALAQLEGGRNFGWVDGYVVEQAPQTVADFVRQRRRWFSGLAKVAIYAPAPWWSRLALILFIGTWSLTLFGVLYTATNLVLGLYTPVAIAWLAAACYSWYVTMYVEGLALNFRVLGAEIPRWKKAVYYVAQVLLVPVFGVMEAAGVVYAVLRPERGFHVIDKPATAATELPPVRPEPATV